MTSPPRAVIITDNKIRPGWEVTMAQSVNVVVCMAGRDIIGSLQIPDGLRISDYLNDRPKIQSDFLCLKEATIKIEDGTRETLQTVYINKKSVQMITTLEADLAQGIGALAGRKPYPFTKKRPIRTKIHLSGYELGCFLHHAESSGITDLFTQEQTFIPCTQPTIYDFNSNSHWKVGFAMINKNHVSCFEEEEQNASYLSVNRSS